MAGTDAKGNCLFLLGFGSQGVKIALLRASCTGARTTGTLLSLF